MKRSIAFLVFVLGVLFLVPAVAQAQDATPAADGTPTSPVISAIIDDADDSALIKVNGDAAVNAGDTIHNAVVINGNLQIDGTVEDNVFVAKGDATVTGTVKGTITVLRGTLNLEAGSSVDDVILFDSDINRADGATVTGDIDDRGLDFSFGRGLRDLLILWWVGTTILALVAAAVFAWLGRNQLFGSMHTLKGDFVKSLITSIVIWILLPLLAALVLFTVVGAPLGLTILLVVLPILWLVGLIVVGTWLGSLILKPETTGRSIAAAVLGTLIISLLSLIPFVGVITGIAALLGSGAFVYRAFNRTKEAPAVRPLAPSI